MWWHGLHRFDNLYQPLRLHLYFCMVVPVPVALEHNLDEIGLSQNLAVSEVRIRARERECIDCIYDFCLLDSASFYV